MLRCLSFLALMLPFTCVTAHAQQYPDHPVRVVVGYAAGGGPDVQARTVAQQLSLDLGQQFFVENRVGANGTIATRSVVQSKPDGYTLLFSSNGIAPHPTFTKTLATTCSLISRQLQPSAFSTASSCWSTPNHRTRRWKDLSTTPNKIMPSTVHRAWVTGCTSPPRFSANTPRLKCSTFPTKARPK